MPSLIARLRREEEGSILALFLVLATAVLLVSAFVIDIGNWWEHRRHLQTQVDAGVLATSRDFSFCFVAPDTANAKIAAAARKYAGDPAVTGSYNQQVGNANSVSMVLNGTDWPPTGVDAFTPTPVPARMPCALRALEIKAKDANIPAVFSGLLPDSLDFVDAKAKAKVEIRKVDVFKGLLPWAVPDIDPTTVAALFFDETAASPTVQPYLLNNQGQLYTKEFTNGEPATIWGGDALGVTITPRTGMVVLQSSDTLTAADLTGSLSTVCGAARRTCYAGSTPTSGLGFIRGYSTGTPGTPAAAQLRDVQLTNLCPTNGTPPAAVTPTDDSGPYFFLKADCDVGVQAQIDFGAVPQPPGVDVNVKGPNCNGSGCPMTYDATLFGGAGGWKTTSSSLHVDALAGRVNGIEITWKTSTSGGGTQTFGTQIAHPYAVDDASGPVTYLTLTKPVGGYSNTLQTGTRDIHVEVGLRPSLQVGQAGETPILLRFASPSGSLNQALDCDAGATFSQEIINGCQQPYRVNPTGDCSAYPSPSDLPPSPLDPDPANAPTCVSAKTGDVNAFRTALHDRFETPCTPNLWPDNPNPTNLPPDDDPRWVTLVVTNFAQFSGSGATNVPVTHFAGFYATGWDISTGGAPGQTQGCPDPDGAGPLKGNDPHPLGADNRNDNGDVWGHFITIVRFVPGGTESQDLCQFDEIGLCTAVLTE